jgi:hypothetical protein
MKPSSQPSRTPSILSDSVHQRLNMYALAATAAGVGLLGLAQPAEARVVYTPTHKVIGKNAAYTLDLNNDGIGDFFIENMTRSFGNLLINSLMVRHGGTNGVEGFHRSPDTILASAFKWGAKIPRAGRFFYSRGEMIAQCADGTTDGGPPCSSHRTNTLGYWMNVKNRYLGLMFHIHGETHYGWARLSVRVSRTQHTVTAALTGYAYETIPNKPIVAGRTKVTVQPSSLGHLAAGASAIPAWRVKRTATTTH